MKIIISIILTLIVSLLAASNTTTKTPPVIAENPPQTATTIYVEYTSETMLTTAEKAIVSEIAKTEITVTTTRPATTTSKTEVNKTEEYTEITEQPPMATEEKTENIDKGNQGLAEYKPQIGGQPNPFENDVQTEIKEHPVEEYITEGGYRPGEGIHF